MWNWGALFTVLLLTTPAYAQGPQAAGQHISVLGCVARGVEVGCLVIKDDATGKTYQINAAHPPPDPARNLVVRLQGQIAGAMDFCQQGPVLNEISWNYTEKPCPADQSK